MRKSQFLSFTITSTLLLSTLCFAAETTVEYSERYKAQLAKAKDQTSDIKSLSPSSLQTQKELICASRGQVYLSSSLAGLTVNLADQNGRMDFTLFFSWTDLNHTEVVDQICDPNQEIKHFSSRDGLTRCTPNRLVNCSLN